MIKNLKFYLKEALKKHFAIGAFNFNNLESLQSIVNASLTTNSPAIIAVTESAIKYIGEEYLISIVHAAKQQNPALFLHLDHGKNFKICKKAVDLGFDSVMIDGSDLPFKKNVNLTKKVVNYAHEKGVLVEGELGQIKGVEDKIDISKSIYTDPKLAFEFVKQTDVDMLAIAIGTSHGINKFIKTPLLRLDILTQIENLLPNMPLVLHGASTIDKKLIDTFNYYGGKIEKAKGVSKRLLINTVKKHNIVKINTDSDIRLAFSSEIRKVLSENKQEIDFRKYIGKGRKKAEQIISIKMKNLLFSAGQK